MSDQSERPITAATFELPQDESQVDTLVQNLIDRLSPTQIFEVMEFLAASGLTHIPIVSMLKKLNDSEITASFDYPQKTD